MAAVIHLRGIRIHLLAGLLLAHGAARAAAQSPAPPPALANWSGAIRCELQSQATGYAHQETQIWTLAGPPMVQGSVTIYPTTWTVTGQGWHDRTRNTTRRVAQWTVNIPGANTPRNAAIGFQLHPVGGGFDVARRNAQLTTGGGYTGPDQFIQDGVPQPPTRLVGTVYEWPFPKIDAATPQTQLTGSNTAEVKAFLGPLQPPEAQSIVTCAWALGRGSAPAPALPPSTLTPQPAPGTLAQGGTPQPASPGPATPAPAASPGTAPPPTTATAPPTSTATAPTAGTSPSQPPVTSAPPAVGAQPGSGPAGAPPAGSSMIAGVSQSSRLESLDRFIATCVAVPYSRFNYNAEPGGAVFNLPQQPGIDGYRIWRRDLGELTASPITASSYTHEAPLFFSTTYQYDIVGIRRDGTCIISSLNVVPYRPQMPRYTRTNVVSTATTNKVTLNWASAFDYPTHVLVLGDGLSPSGVEVKQAPRGSISDGYSMDITIPRGAPYAVWLITPMWKTPNGVMLVPNTGAPRSASFDSTDPYGARIPATAWDPLQAAVQKAADAYKSGN